jgi:hypothetical protein
LVPVIIQFLPQLPTLFLQVGQVRLHQSEAFFQLRLTATLVVLRGRSLGPGGLEGHGQPLHFRLLLADGLFLLIVADGGSGDLPVQLLDGLGQFQLLLCSVDNALSHRGRWVLHGQPQFLSGLTDDEAQCFRVPDRYS